MKLSAREDIAVPMEQVFASVTDVATLERQALRRGLVVTRLDGEGPPGIGARWQVGFEWRGRKRTATTEITGWDPGQKVLFVTTGEGLRGEGEVDLTRLAAARTRLHVTIDLKAETFRARLMLQSLKLAKAALLHRFRDKVAGFSRRIEDVRR